MRQSHHHDNRLQLTSRLQRLRQDLLQLADKEFKELRNEFGSAGGSPVEENSADAETTSRLAEMTSNELHEIDHALEQIDRNSYGRCESCGRKILASRLRALPFTTLCIDCRRAFEEKTSTGGSGIDWQLDDDRLPLDRGERPATEN